MVSPTCRRCCFLMLVCLFLTGCVTKSVTESGISVQYHWGIALGALAAGLLAAPLGLVVRSFSTRLSWGLFVLSPVAVLMIAPSAYNEGVTIHADGFEVHSGIWGLTASQAVKFDNVTAVRLTEESTGGRRSRQIEVLYFDLKEGGSARLPLNNDVKIEAAKEILPLVDERQIPLVGFH
jgi:hypothetical protein